MTETLALLNPATEELLGHQPLASRDEVDAAVGRAVHFAEYGCSVTESLDFARVQLGKRRCRDETQSTADGQLLHLVPPIEK